jgi:hypothetical protein
MLSHCGLDRPALVVAAVVGQTDRAVRKARRFKPGEFWRRMREARRGHPKAKLSSQDVGLVAKFLAEHKRCSVAEMLAFIKDTFGLDMDRLTLRRLLRRYGLGCLWKDRISNAPFCRPDRLRRRFRPHRRSGSALSERRRVLCRPRHRAVCRCFLPESATVVLGVLQEGRT